MATSNSIVGYTAREQGVSSDLVRMQKLASRELQTVMRDASRAPNNVGFVIGRTADTGTIGTPVTGCRLAATLTAGPGVFEMAYGAGEVEFSYGVGVGADESDYQVVRWPAGIATHTPPDPVNDRYDLIIATPGTVSTDLQSRNVLLDPIARTITAQNVFKTINPLATISVLAGTPGDFSPPATPAGTVALFEVYVPAAAPNSTTFEPVRRTWPRIEGPFASSHGILNGIKLFWSQEADETTASEISMQPGADNDVVIDGERLRFGTNLAFSTATGVGMFQDFAPNNPFSAAAGGTDEPYYIYAVGGRHAPQATRSAANFPMAPVAFIESTVAPNQFGYPSAAIRDPRVIGGPATVIRGAIFVGIGYKITGTTLRKGVVNNGGWVYPKTGIPTGGRRLLAFNEPSVMSAIAPAAVTTFSLGSTFSNATAGKLGFLLNTFFGSADMAVGYGTSAPGVVAHELARLSALSYVEVDAHSMTELFSVESTVAPLQVYVFPRAYKTGAPILRP